MLEVTAVPLVPPSRHLFPPRRARVHQAVQVGPGVSVQRWHQAMRSVVHQRLAMGGMALFRKRAQNLRVDLTSSEIGPVTGFGGATHPARERPE